MAAHTDETTLARPLNVELIVQKASNFDYNPLIPLKYWLRTATTLLKEASPKEVTQEVSFSDLS
jgi:STAM-binding protein